MNYANDKLAELYQVRDVAEGKQHIIEEDKIDLDNKAVKELLENTEVIWKPHPGPQEAFLQATEDEVLFSGGRGSGKSDCLIVDPLRYVSNKNFKGLIIRKTMPELRELIDRAKKLYPLVYPGVKWREADKLFVFPSGSSLEYGYAEHDDDLQRYIGREFTWLGIDEITLFKDSKIIENLKLSLRSPDPTLPIHIRATTNPFGPGKRWVKERWVDLGPEDNRITLNFEVDGEIHYQTRRWLHSTIDNNPTLKKSNPRYKSSLLAIENEDQKRAWLHGSWEGGSGSAFSEFSRSIHVIKPFKVPGGWKRILGCDWGFSSMAAALWLAIDPDGTVYVYREYIASHTRVDVFAQNLLRMQQGETIRASYLDSSVFHRKGEIGETPADTMIRMGIPFIPSDRSQGSRIASKMLIHEYLSTDRDSNKPKLFIFDTCLELISELSNLPVDKTDPEDVDSKAVDHAYDALRYAMQHLPSLSSAYSMLQRRFESPKPIIVDRISGY
jgi:hypothetical protein